MTYIRPDGRTRFAVPGPTVRAMLGDRALNIMRGDIEDVLYDHVREHAEIRFGATVQAVAQHGRHVTATLSDGTAATADLLVGADGLHSTTRELVFGPERDYRLDLDHLAGVYLMRRPPERVPAGVTATLTATGRTLAIINLGGADGERRAAAFFGYRTGDVARDLADGPHVALPRVYGDLGWAVPEALAQLATAESVYFDTISQIILPRWTTGRVALLGDAAWCVTLFAGYGCSLAVAGADRFGTHLQHADDIPAALAAWEAELRPEAIKKQRLGRRVKGLYAPADPFRLWLRDAPLRLSTWPPITHLLQRRLQLKG